MKRLLLTLLLACFAAGCTSSHKGSLWPGKHPKADPVADGGVDKTGRCGAHYRQRLAYKGELEVTIEVQDDLAEPVPGRKVKAITSDRRRHEFTSGQLGTATGALTSFEVVWLVTDRNGIWYEYSQRPHQDDGIGPGCKLRLVFVVDDELATGTEEAVGGDSASTSQPGACCLTALGSMQCAPSPRENCIRAGGAWQGAGVRCDSDPCGSLRPTRESSPGDMLLRWVSTDDPLVWVNARATGATMYHVSSSCPRVRSDATARGLAYAIEDGRTSCPDCGHGGGLQ